MTTDSTLVFWMSVLFPLTGIVFILLIRVLHQRYLLQRQQAGVGYLVELKKLLLLTQRHRGSSYGAINGDNELRKVIPDIERPIEDCIRNLNKLGEAGRQKDHWLAFIDHWQRLQKNNLNIDAENNLAQHNQIISVLLYLLEDVAESACLNGNCQPSLEYIWRDLPRAAELIGQARVLGSGIMASGSADSVHKIRMRFVRSRLEEFITDNGSADKKLLELMQVIDQQILQDGQRMSAREYFDLSTQAMEPFFRRIDEGLEGLKQQLRVH